MTSTEGGSTAQAAPPAATQPAASSTAQQGIELSQVSIDAPIVQTHNEYLAEQSSVIRLRTIPWEGYQKASLITEQELALIRAFSKDCKNASEYVDLFLGLLQKLARVDTIQSILVLIDDFCENRPAEICGLFLKSGAGRPPPSSSLAANPSSSSQDPSCFLPLFKLLSKEDEYIQLKAAKIATLLLVESKRDYPTDASQLFQYLILQLSNSNGNVVDVSLQLLQGLLSIQGYRSIFFSMEGAMPSVLSVLKKDQASSQIQYQAIFIVWMVSFVRDACADLERVYHIIPLFKDIAKSAIKEKVVRIILSTLKNMLLQAPQENIIPMLGHKLLQAFEVLGTRKWSDGEILEDLNFLRDELSHHVASLSTFDEYASEVRSGRLEWSPPHQSEQFWKTNATRLNEDRHELVKLLIDIASNSKESIILAVAAHDLGQYVKYGGTTAKKALEDFGGKSVVMQLMENENADVRYQALAATQSIMINSW